MASPFQAPFPLSFPSLRTVSGAGSAPYIIGAMFTASHAQQAARLAASCTKFALPFELHEVPAVHRSTSIKGSDDLKLTKANFIHDLLRIHKKPVLYLDADCEISADPVLIAELARTRCDFAIYNWLADDYTDRFYPLTLAAEGATSEPDRYYQYRGSIDLVSSSQLYAAGLAQFYANSIAARALLARWHRTIVEFPGCADDDCLSFTYNNLRKRDWLYWALKTRWLPKAYARVMFWIYVAPVINHPDILGASSRFPRMECPRGRKRFYMSMTQKRVGPLLFPRDCIIDTKAGLLCRLVDGKLVPFEKTAQQFWV